MNILYYFAEDQTYMTQWQRFHIFDEMERQGHHIEVFNPLKYNNVYEANERLIHFISQSHGKYKLFMNCLSDKYLFSETIQSVNKIGIPTLLICFDNLHAPYMHKEIIPFFDLVWITSIETKYLFEKWGCKNIIFQPYAANPFLFSPNWDSAIYSIGFIGSPYGSRINKINLLSSNEISCLVYSDETANISQKKGYLNVMGVSALLGEILKSLSFAVGRKVLLGAVINKIFTISHEALKRNQFISFLPSVNFPEMNYLYSNFTLSLNITELRNTYVLKHPIHKLHLRTFEIPMAGGVEFASYTDELSNYFEDNQEIVLYKTVEEMIDKAKFYLKPENSSLVSKIKIKARKKAESEHTWSRRFETIFKKMEI